MDADRREAKIRAAAMSAWVRQKRVLQRRAAMLAATEERMVALGLDIPSPEKAEAR